MSVLHYSPASNLARALPSTRFVAPPVSLLRTNDLTVVQEFPPVFHRLRRYVLALGPDLPWVDEPSPGNLRFSAAWFLTRLSLLIPAFSLVCTPRLLTLTLRRAYIAPLPLRDWLCQSGNPKLRWTASAPFIFGAESLD